VVPQGIKRGIKSEDRFRAVIGGIQNEATDMIQMGMGEDIGFDMLAQYLAFECQR
jgi:hypothetical protein